MGEKKVKPLNTLLWANWCSLGENLHVNLTTEHLVVLSKDIFTSLFGVDSSKWAPTPVFSSGEAPFQASLHLQMLTRKMTG